MRYRVLVLLAGFLALPALGEENWPQFRGPSQEGHSDAKQLPLKWSEKENVKWKTAIPGVGWSSPVIWGEQVWMTTSTPDGRSRRAICVDKNTGKIIHDIEAFKVDRVEKKNGFNSYASPTPVIEEGRVYVAFGTVGHACIETATGTILWKNEELKLDHSEGSGSSPVLHKALYIVNCDGIDVQYIAALDKLTGKLAWKTKRGYDFEGKHVMGEMRKAYSIPTIAEVDGAEQLISAGAKRVYGYDPDTGKEIWGCDIFGFSVTPRPIVRDGVVYVCTGYMKAELVAIRIAGDRGGISENAILWDVMQSIPLKPSLMVIDDRIYLVTDNGIARCLDRATGKAVWQKRIGSGFSASPLYAGGRIYFFSETGEAIIMKPGDEPIVAAENTLDDGFMASPAVSGEALYLRTKTHLYRIEQAR